MDYMLHIATLITIYSILSVSLNLVVGSIGIVSVAHGALFGVGAYVYAIFTTQYQFPSVLMILVGGMVTVLLGYLAAFPSLRLRDDYLALATFGLAIAAHDAFNNLLSITKGPMGITGVPRPSILGYTFADTTYFLVLTVLFAVVGFLLINKLKKSPWGRTVHAIRECETAVLLGGKDPRKYKLTTFAFASFWAGVAGALYGSYISYIHPSNFVPMTSIVLLCMVIVGGMGSLAGSVAGAFIFVALPEILRLVKISTSTAGTINQLLFGILIILFMLMRPQGIFGRQRILNE